MLVWLVPLALPIWSVLGTIRTSRWTKFRGNLSTALTARIAVTNTLFSQAFERLVLQLPEGYQIVSFAASTTYPQTVADERHIFHL